MSSSIQMLVAMSGYCAIVIAIGIFFAKKANQKPCLTVKDFQEDLADCGVVVHCPPVQGYLPKYDLHGSMFGEERVKMFWTS